MSFSFYNANGQVVNSQAVNKASKPVQSITTKRPIVHHVLYRMSKLTKDTFWITLLESWSTGKFKRGFKFQDKRVCYTLKKKVITSEQLLNGDLEDFLMFKEFLKTNANIMSDADRIYMSKKMDEDIEKISNANEKARNISLYVKTNEVLDCLNVCISKMQFDDQKQMVDYKDKLLLKMIAGGIDKGQDITRDNKGMIVDFGNPSIHLNTKRPSYPEQCSYVPAK